MLIEKNSTEIVSISISGGLEILGRLTDEEGELYIENAMALAQTPQGIAIVKWPNSGNNKKVWINKDQIVAKAPAMKEIADKYIEANSGITIVG